MGWLQGGGEGVGGEAQKGNEGKGSIRPSHPPAPLRPHLKLLGGGSEKMMLSHDISPRTGRFNSPNENSENSCFCESTRLGKLLLGQ